MSRRSQQGRELGLNSTPSTGKTDENYNQQVECGGQWMKGV